MQLTHRFSVPAPIDVAWKALGDIEQVAICMPGAQLGSFDGERFDGRVKVKVGPMQLTYGGEGRLLERDDASHSIAIEASGKEAKGQGTAKAHVRAMLTADGAATIVEVVTDLDITGKPAQFGRSALSDVGGKLIELFAAQLATHLEGGATVPAAGADGPVAMVGGSRPRAEKASGGDDVIDLLALAGGSQLKKYAPIAIGIVAGLLLLRRRR